MQMRYNFAKESGIFKVLFKGHLDEDSHFLPMVFPLGTSELVIDFDQVEGINSCGIRLWIAWSDGLPSEIPKRLINCPQSIIQQMNIRAKMVPINGTVDSFYIPYFCEKCSGVSNHKITHDEVSGSQHFHPQQSIDCHKCGSEAIIDVNESYYSFVSYELYSSF